MDYLKKYKRIVRQILEKHASHHSTDMPYVGNKVIIDEEGLNFILVVFGWHKKEYIYNIAFHIQLKDGKIWIHEDLTDVGIANEFISAGIPENDIVMGYLKPYPPEVSSAKVA